MKIDIEGMEYSALLGLGGSISYIKVIQFEFGGTCIDTRIFFQDFWYFLTKNKFKIFRITPFGLYEINSYRESDEFFSFTNFLAVNQNISVNK